MQVELEKTSTVTCTLSITVPASQVDEAFKRAYREVGKNARVPGFRKGKVPPGVLEAHYGPQVRSEAENLLIRESLSDALKQKEVEPVSMPEVDSAEVTKGQDFSYKVQVETSPEITLEKATGFELEEIEVTVDPAKVQEELERLQKKAAQLVPVLDRDVVQEGDVATIDYLGTLNGEPFEGGSAENAMVQVGGEGFIPGFSEGLVGAKVPGERVVSVTFPEDYQAEHLAGQPAEFQVTLRELKKQDLPTLDDEFAQDLGEDSLNALTEKIETQLRERGEQEARSESRKAALQALIDANPFEVPPSMIRNQAEQLVQSAAAQVQAMMGGQQFNLSGAELAQLAEGRMEDAEFQVRSGLLLMEVVKSADISVDDAEIDAEIDSEVARAGEQGPRLAAQLRRPDQRDRVRYQLVEDKALAYVRTGEVPPKIVPEAAEGRISVEVPEAEAALGTQDTGEKEASLAPTDDATPPDDSDAAVETQEQ